MKRQFIIYLVCILMGFTSCTGQNVKLKIINRSILAIDSISIPEINILEKVKLKPGFDKTFLIDVSNLSRFTPYSEVILYQSKRVWKASWGKRDDYKTFDKLEEDIFLFDSGFNNVDVPLKKPKIFFLTVNNFSKERLDTIEFYNNCIITKTNDGVDITTFKIEASKFQKNPLLKIVLEKREYSYIINHDWSNWNNYSKIIYIHGNGQILDSDQEKYKIEQNAK